MCVLYVMCACVCVLMRETGCLSLLFLRASVLAFKTVDSIQLVLLVRKAIEPDSRLCGAASSTGLGDRVADTTVGQPAGITAVVAQQFPSGVHLPHLGNLGTVLLACPDRLVIS